jgi:hypothetical protein
MAMKKLGERNFKLISSGVKCLGSYDPDEIFSFFEERLYIDEADTIYNFLKWVHDNNLTFGSANYEIRFKEFLNKK